MIEKAAFTIAELAERGPLGRTGIYKAIAEGKLLARKAGRKTVILTRDFEEYLDALPRATIGVGSRHNDSAAGS